MPGAWTPRPARVSQPGPCRGSPRETGSDGATETGVYLCRAPRGLWPTRSDRRTCSDPVPPAPRVQSRPETPASQSPASWPVLTSACAGEAGSPSRLHLRRSHADRVADCRRPEARALEVTRRWKRASGVGGGAGVQRDPTGRGVTNAPAGGIPRLDLSGAGYLRPPFAQSCCSSHCLSEVLVICIFRLDSPPMPWATDKLES